MFLKGYDYYRFYTFICFPIKNHGMPKVSGQQEVLLITSYGNQLFNKLKSNGTNLCALMTQESDASLLTASSRDIICWLLDSQSGELPACWPSQMQQLPEAYHVAIISVPCPRLVEKAMKGGANDVIETSALNDAGMSRIRLQATQHQQQRNAYKKIQRSLKESKDNYTRLVDQLADGIAIYEEQGKILEINSSASRMLGYTTEELKKLNIFDLLAPGELIQNPVDINKLKNGQHTLKQRKMVRKDGRVIEAEVHTSNLRDGIFLTSVRDISDRLEAREHLQKEKMISDTIINSMPGLFYMFNQDGKYLRWNRQLELVSGYSYSEIKDMHPSNFFAEKEHPVLFKEISNVFLHGQSALEAHLVTKHGMMIPYYFTGVAATIDGERCLLGTAIDLSPLRSLERKLANQKVAEQKKMMQVMLEAEENEKNKLGLELHDNINQMLSVVRLYLSAIINEGARASVTIEDAMSILNDAMEEIRQLSHRLAVAYRFDAGLVKEIKNLADKIQGGKKLTVELDLPAALDERTDYKEKLCIYRIVQEQINNITKYAHAAMVKISVVFTGHHLELTIVDDGVGFDVEAANKGLGLISIRNRAEALQGTSEITSIPGTGTTLKVQLPVKVH